MGSLWGLGSRGVVSWKLVVHRKKIDDGGGGGVVRLFLRIY